MLKRIKNVTIITISIFSMAIGVYFFKFPNNFCFGGVTGAAVVFAKITPLSASTFSCKYGAFDRRLSFPGEKVCTENNLCDHIIIRSAPFI